MWLYSSHIALLRFIATAIIWIRHEIYYLAIIELCLLYVYDVYSRLEYIKLSNFHSVMQSASSQSFLYHKIKIQLINNSSNCGIAFPCAKKNVRFPVRPWSLYLRPNTTVSNRSIEEFPSVIRESAAVLFPPTTWRVTGKFAGTCVYALTCERMRVSERCALAEPVVTQAGRATRDRQPDLLPSPVIIIIKSTLRAVRALVKECFISSARPLCLPPFPKHAEQPVFRPPRGYNITYGKPPWPPLGPSALRKPAGHASLFSSSQHTLRPENR